MKDLEIYDTVYITEHPEGEDNRVIPATLVSFGTSKRNPYEVTARTNLLVLHVLDGENDGQGSFYHIPVFKVASVPNHQGEVDSRFTEGEAVDDVFSGWELSFSDDDVPPPEKWFVSFSDLTEFTPE